MRWTLHYDPNAFKELAKLDKDVQRKIKHYLAEICCLDDPAARGHGLTGPWAGLHRYRLGQIRIIVSIERTEVTVSDIKINRRDTVY